jgi:hypothetical protein
MEFGIYIPIDSRRLKYSTKEYKNRLLGNHISNILIFVNKKDSILEQIKHCQEEMIKSYNSFEGGHSFITMNNLMDINTQNINYIPEFPDNSSKNIIFASHIGCVPERENVKFGLFMLFLNGVIGLIFMLFIIVKFLDLLLKDHIMLIKNMLTVFIILLRKYMIL